MAAGNPWPMHDTVSRGAGSFISALPTLATARLLHAVFASDRMILRYNLPARTGINQGRPAEGAHSAT